MDTLICADCAVYVCWSSLLPAVRKICPTGPSFLWPSVRYYWITTPGTGKETRSMRHFFLVVLLFTAGCENLRGPFAPRSPARVDDPSLSIAEQQVLGRDRIGLPDNSSVLPSEAGARPGR